MRLRHVCECVCLCLNSKSMRCIPVSRQPFDYVALVSFPSKVKEKHVSGDKDDKMQFVHIRTQQMHRCTCVCTDKEAYPPQPSPHTHKLQLENGTLVIHVAAFVLR